MVLFANIRLFSQTYADAESEARTLRGSPRIFWAGLLFRGLARPGCKEIAHPALTFNAKQVSATLLCYFNIIAFRIGNGTFIVAVPCSTGIAQNCDAGRLESCSHIVNILPAAHRD